MTARVTIHCSENSVIDADADSVWRTLRDFGQIHDWHPAITQTQIHTAEGQVHRHLTVAGADLELVERLESSDDAALQLSYSLVRSPWDMRDYLATVSVSAVEGGGSEISWKGRFTAPEDQAEMLRDIVSGGYRAGLKGLRRKFA